ncbi:8-amino-7-oxononanoate synthase [Salininema proteolyticum]|uniref:8-amino-7-oxononanoate synthase n=1 Tax=Salininema proteolyticum TaxID=1607685 RepID=A0ABV8U280_9ACTN
MPSVWDRLGRKAELRSRAGLSRRPSPRRDLVDLASNDYLGLSAHSEVVDSAAAALREHGVGAGSSRAVRGTVGLHEELEEELARLSGRSSCLVYSSGYMANLGAVAALTPVRRGELRVLFDEHVHASLHDAARLAGAESIMVPHNDLNAFASLLAEHRPPLVVVESVYSVLGDAAPLRELESLCAEFEALLLVDEAHAFGVRGAEGGGLARGLSEETVVVSGTLSKAFASAGGFLVGPSVLRRHLVDTSRPFLYDTAPPPSVAAGALAALRISRSADDARERIRARIEAAAKRFGVAPSDGAILSVPAGEAAAAVEWQARAAGRGIAVGCFRPPSTPDHVSRLRLTVNASLPEAVFQEALDVLEEVRP